MHSLAAEIRTSETGKTTARKIRTEGKVPAVVYGGGSLAVSLNIDPDEIVEVFRKTGDRNTVVHLDFSKTDVPADVKKAWADSGALTKQGTVPCMVKAVQRHPLRRDIEHIDFYWLAPGQVVEAMVPLAGVGRAAGMTIGGRLRLIRREIKIRCAWEKLPKVLEYDITPMNIGDMVKASELTLPEGVSVVTRNDFNVLTLYGKRVSNKPAAAVAAKKKK
jgi:large subunit ribosomal protein L25